MFFFFKQRTAYEMRSRDWSSDVCSSDLIGNAPPPGEPVYSGQTSPGARLPHGSVAASPVNNNIELLYPNGVPVPYYYTNPTMIGFTGGGGSTYGGGAEPIIMPVVEIGRAHV